jgi:DNA-directed RNA polymerase II subunit RPB2
MDVPDVWKLVYGYFNHNHERQLVKHLIDSYNDFVMRKIDLIMESFNPVEIFNTFLPDEQKYKHVITIKLSNPSLSKPMIFEKDGSTKIMTPHDARTRGFSYSAPLVVDVSVFVQTFQEDVKEYTSDTRLFSSVPLGKIPIMVRSRYCILSNPSNLDIFDEECRYDVGGYFVVNGNEKVVISSDRISENRMYAFVNSKVSTYSHMVDVRSVQEGTFCVPKITSVKMSSRPNQFGHFVRVSVQHIRIDVPLFVIFRALGIESDRAILDSCQDVNAEDLAGSIEDGNFVYTTEQALDYLSKHLIISNYPRELASKTDVRLDILRSVIQKDLLPHVGTDFSKKAAYLGRMVKRLFDCVGGKRLLDDRDSYINKRVDTPGILIANLFRQHYAKVRRFFKKSAQKLHCGAFSKKTYHPYGDVFVCR